MLPGSAGRRRASARCRYRGSSRASAIELKVGVVTALIGVPFFLAMIFGERRFLEGETA